MASESAEIFPFSSYFYNGRLRAETKPISCMNCDTLEDLEILLAAEHSDGRIALRLDSDNVGERTLIAAPIESTVLTAPAYALMNRAGGDTFQVEPLKPKVELLFQERITIGSSIFSGSRRYDVDANITANGSVELSTPSPAESTKTFALDLPVYTSAGYVEQDNVEFRTLLSDLTITDVVDGVVAISGNVQLQLVDEDSLASPINEYDDLVGALATQIPVVAIYSELQPIDYPEFEEGDKYLFNLAHESEAFSEFRRFGSLTFTGSETADIEIDILDPMAMRQQTFAVTYSVDGNTMSIVFAGKTYEHQLYTNIFGQRVTVSEYSFDDSTVITNYPFAKKEPIELTQATLLGHWQGQTFTNTFDGTTEILWFADEMFMERVFNVDYFNQADDFYRLNEDNTVSILRRYQCLTATNYAECEQ